MKQLFYVKVTKEIADKLVNDYKEYLSNDSINYYQVSSLFLTVNFNQYVFDKYNATFDSNKNNIIFQTQKEMNWFLLQV